MANAKEIKRKVILESESYKLVFTNHWEERMKERWISLDLVIDSIKNYDETYLREGKQVVEKKNNLGTIRTVFYIKSNHITLITSMILWK